MKNAMLDLLKTRRSIRQYQDRQVAAGELDAVLEAGTFAPSGKGAQSATIVAVQDKDTVAQLSRMNAKVMGVDKDPYYGSPTILVVFADSAMPTYVQDGCCVLMNMMHAAHALGLGSCWINREKEMFESPEGKDLMKAWGVPQNLVGIGALAFGYPAGDPAQPAPRKKDYIVKVG